MATGTRCLVVDDHSVLAEGSRSSSVTSTTSSLVGRVSTGEDAIEAVTQLKPEIVLMDVRLPGIDGVSAVKRIHASSPRLSS